MTAEQLEALKKQAFVRAYNARIIDRRVLEKNLFAAYDSGRVSHSLMLEITLACE